MYCKNCGAQIAGNDKFCRNCGAPAKYALGRPEKEKAFWRHAWFTIFMLFMCFPVGVILVFINHPSVAKTFLMFILGLIVLGIVAVSSCLSELALSCGISVEEAAISLDAISPITSLSDYVYGEDSVTYEGVLADDESTLESERICDRVALAQSIAKLPALWQRIVLMRYYRNMTQQQTATALGLTQVKISREEKKILAALRKTMS